MGKRRPHAGHSRISSVTEDADSRAPTFPFAIRPYVWLAPGAGVRQAAEEAARLACSIAEAHPETNRGWGASVSSETATRLAADPGIVLLLTALFVVVAVNLLVASANVANFMLTRGRARSREIAIRMALGTGRLRVITSSVSPVSTHFSLAGSAFWHSQSQRSASTASLPIRWNRGLVK